MGSNMCDPNSIVLREVKVGDKNLQINCIVLENGKIMSSGNGYELKMSQQISSVWKKHHAQSIGSQNVHIPTSLPVYPNRRVSQKTKINRSIINYGPELGWNNAYFPSSKKYMYSSSFYSTLMLVPNPQSSQLMASPQRLRLQVTWKTN